ncbi:MAG: O-methyltransferase [Hyphomonadaceae bacterium]|nr:O-methyltransferase [Hyphomonadaceae bacterium]
MTERRWKEVDTYFVDKIVGMDDALDQCLREAEAAGLPQAAVSPAQGKMLHLMAKSIGAKRILEVGTLGGYSAIWLARALPPDGKLVTLEIDPKHAKVAQTSVAAAGLAKLVEIRTGAALDLLPDVKGPFDFSFIDADKENNPAYFEHALRLSRKGAIIIVDNVVRGGAVTDPNGGSQVQGVRRLFDKLANETRVSATAIQTVGDKGYDGFLMAVVN